MIIRLFLALSALSTLALGQASTPPLFGFMPNSGQFPPAIRFVRHAPNNFFYLTNDSFVLVNGIRVQIAGIAPNVQPVGDSPTSTVYNFYRGNQPSQWVTNAHLFGAVKLNNVYPGVTAAFATSTQTRGVVNTGFGVVTFSIAPGADPSPIQVSVLNTGAPPMQVSASSVWFVGGRIPGVFNVGAQATQTVGGAGKTVTCNLIVNSSGTLSIQLPDLDASAQTDVAITFPDYDLITSQLSPGFLPSVIQYPQNFGQDGLVPSANCGTTGAYCTKAVIAKVDATGKPVWVTMFGGSRNESASGATLSQTGVAVSGQTASADFPVTAAAPHSSPGSSNDVFLAYFDGTSGALRSATYGGLSGAYVGQQVADSAGDAVVSGGLTDGDSHGFILLWQPQQNRFLYTRLVGAPVARMVFDASSNLYFASYVISGTGNAIDAGELDSAGNLVGPVVRVKVPASMQPANSQLQPAGKDGLWLLYEVFGTNSRAASLWVARILPSPGQIALNTRVLDQGAIVETGLTPSGNLKLLATTAPDEATSPDAQLAAACPLSSYFLVLSPTAQMVYATYVPIAGFDFASQNESAGTPPPSIACFAAAAGRHPTTFAAPGELITITGAGFGPLNPVYTAPGSDGLYPSTAMGFSVKVGGLKAPIIALARGLIAVQVPFEVAAIVGPAQPTALEVSQDGQPFPSIPLTVISPTLTLFDTGDANNEFNLPALVALNQDGTVNSVTNPAPAGSFISVYASGAGILSPPLVTGGLSPIPPAGPLSETPLLIACFGCSKVTHLGSAPGLSTSVQQINLQLPAVVPGNGVRAQGIGVAVGLSSTGLLAQPTGVVFIQ